MITKLVPHTIVKLHCHFHLRRCVYTISNPPLYILPSCCLGLLPISLRRARSDVVFVHGAERIYALHFHSVSCLYDTYNDAGARELVAFIQALPSQFIQDLELTGARISCVLIPKHVSSYTRIYLEDAYFVSILHRLCALYAL